METTVQENKKTISLIIPCYNEEKSIPHIYKELKKISEKLTNYEFTFLFINDGSTDETLLKLKALKTLDGRVKYISFSRNFGKEAAMYAGFCNVNSDYVAVMDADLQDPPSLLPQMLEILETKEYDSVATRRVTRAGEPAIRSFFARQFYKLINKISDVNIVDGARDFRLMKKSMVEAIVSLSEYNRFSKGIFGWIGYKTYWLSYENVERVAGETKWSFWKLLKYAVEGIVNFSEVPLSIASFGGIGLTVISILAILFVIVRRVIFGDPVAGWASLVCIITFIGGIQLFCLGIIGQYLSKTYLEVKKRPHFIVADSSDENVTKIK